MKKKRTGGKKFKSIDKVFGVEVLVLAGVSPEQVAREVSRWMNWSKDDPLVRDAFTSLGSAALFFDQRRSGRFCIYFKRERPSAADVAHEIFHLVHRAFEQLPLPLVEETREVYAYYIDFWTAQIGYKLW